MTLVEITQLIKDVGFPVFVGTFVLIRLEPTIRELSSNVRVLTAVVAQQQGMTLKEIRAKYGNGKNL